eukprot:7649341-Karenia_brevis.AAC.1
MSYCGALKEVGSPSSRTACPPEAVLAGARASPDLERSRLHPPHHDPSPSVPAIRNSSRKKAGCAELAHEINIPIFTNSSRKKIGCKG